MVAAPLRRIARFAYDRLGLARPYYRYLEWRISRKAEAPPAVDADGTPIPSRYLMMLVDGAGDHVWHLKSGEIAARAFDAFAAEAGCGFRDAKRVLDFGCGVGRVFRHLPKLTDAELYGVDVNARLLRWCGRNLTGRFSRNRLTPPLDFPVAHFDVLYAYSVFTHLRIETQKAWLAEMARVIRPGGAALVTFHDETYAAMPNAEVARAALAAHGVYVHSDQLEGSNNLAIFQTHKMMVELCGEHFDVVRTVSSGESGVGQAVAILRRRGVAGKDG